MSKFIINFLIRNWNELVNVYEILVILINNYFSSSVLKHYLDKQFFTNLLNNIQNYDQDERILIKLIIHKLYSNSFLFRKIILKTIENKLYDISYTSSKYNDLVGIADIFEILSK